MRDACKKFVCICKKPVARWAAGYLAFLAAAAAVVYYWRVFYSWPVSGLWATLGAWAVATALFAALALVGVRVKRFETRTALLVLVCGCVFCFANPPLETPDEILHYLRSYSISMGRLDFDAARGYPGDVNALLGAFRGAWVNGNTEYWLKYDEDGNVSGGGSSAGFAIKEYGDGSRVQIADRFATYAETKDAGLNEAREPLVRQIIPFIPQAAGMALARMAGLGALGCLYAGRLANLAVYAFLCRLALKNCKRYSTVFAAVMLLPMSLYMAASLSYDAMLLGFYYLVASYYCADEIHDKDVATFAFAFVMMNAVKPWINLLWLALPLILPAKAWKAHMKKWQLALCALAGALGITVFVSWYGNTFMYNYPEIGRMLGDTVNGAQQLGFVLRNIPRTVMVFVGSLYENALYLGQLGIFGALDMEIPLVNLFSPVMLCLGAALAVHEKSSLTPRSAAGLGALAVCYIGAALGALYITYTPVGMVRVLGVQARYLLPAFLMLFVLLAALLSHVLEPTLPGARKAQRLELWAGGGFALLSGLLLAQHYFVGPVCPVP